MVTEVNEGQGHLISIKLISDCASA
jgi:hypothetical protein